MTTSSSAASLTDKTYETVPVSNDTFLQAIFENLEADARPIVASFPGHPKTGYGLGIHGKKMMPLFRCPKNITIILLCKLMPDSNGEYKRQKALFSALHAIFLDDIGTKVEIDRPIPPTLLAFGNISGQLSGRLYP